MICDRDTMPARLREQREAGRRQRQNDARLCATPIAPMWAGLRILRWYAVVGVVALLALAIVAVGVV